MDNSPEKIGKYKLIREVGRGATATVYLAEHPQYPDPVALKLVRFDDKSKDEAKWNRRLMKLLRAERDVSSRLDHPNIIKIFDTTVEKDYAYIVMEYFPGTTLEQYCSFQSLLPLHRVIGMVFKCAMALDYAYRQGIVHRDINPRNVMLSGESETGGQGDGETRRFGEQVLPVSPSLHPLVSKAKLIDFGIAKFPQPAGAPPFTQHSVLSGTVAYASPEQCQSRAVDERSDIYSLGVMLYEMLTGERPFKGRTPTEIAIHHLQTEPRPPRQLNPDIPLHLEKAILRALAKAPEDRQQNVQELSEELQAAARQVVIPLAAESFPEVQSEEDVAALHRLTLVRRRRRRVAVAAAALLLAILAGAIFGRNWLSSHALPLLAGTQPSASPTPSPDGTVPSDLDSLELAALLPGDPLSKGSFVKNAVSHSSATNQAGQVSGGQPAPSSSGAVPAGGSTASTTQSTPVSTQRSVETSKPQQQTPPMPAAPVAVNPAPQTSQPAGHSTNQQENTQAARKPEERKIRQREADNSASPPNGNSSYEPPTARRDRIATNRDRDEGNLRRDSRDDDDGNDRESANRQDSDQIGPKLIQWSGRVNGEREVLIDLPGTPGTLEVPRVYRNRVGVIEPPSASNRWRCVRLRVLGEGGVSFVVRWWPKVAEFGRLVGSR